ncbi:MAG TPA: hypothetical protein VF397_01910 [Pyrinomonadaceae bacterium]
MKTVFIALVLCAACFSQACSNGLVKRLTEAAKLRQDLMDKYQEKEVNVNLQNSVFLTVSFVDSALNQEDAGKRAARAQEAAKFVVKSLPSIGKIKTIWIMFVATERRLIVFHYHRSLNEYAFNNRGEIIATMALNSSDDPLSPIVRFNPTSNETDISLTRIQLRGDLKQGIALVPYFTAKGDARAPNGKVAAPAFVVFDFASYADRRIFSSDSDLEIVCDGKTDFSGKAHLLSPQNSNSEGNNAQFLTAQIPFAQFAKMGEASSLKLKLDATQFDVGPEAIAALRRMAAYVTPPLRTGG